MLQALPDTALWHRLEKEGRLRGKSANINQTTLMNVVPTRPLEEIASEYVELEYRQIVKAEIGAQLEQFLANEADAQPEVAIGQALSTR